MCNVLTPSNLSYGLAKPYDKTIHPILYTFEGNRDDIV